MVRNAGQLWQATYQLYCGVGIASTVEGTVSNAGEKRKAPADRQGSAEGVEGALLDAGQLWQAINQLYLGVGIPGGVEGAVSNARKKRKAAADRHRSSE